MGTFVFGNGGFGHGGSDPVPRSLSKKNEEGDGERRGTDMMVAKRLMFNFGESFVRRFRDMGFDYTPGFC